jgi:hypothetical protein
MAKANNNKHPQLIRGCFFGTKAIPDTFTEYKQLYKGYSIYASFKGKQLDTEMLKDFQKLNTDARQTDQLNTNNEKTNEDATLE